MKTERSSTFTNKTKRVAISAFQDLSRNIWLNVTTIVIIVVSLFMIAAMLAIDTVGSHTIKMLQEKIDISVQIKDDAQESKILELKKDLGAMKEVKSIEYVSKDQALINFKEKHKDNAYINQSLEELGANPLFAVLNVKANAIEQYKIIDEYINNNENYKDIITKVSFKENEKAIENFSNILKTIRDGIFALAILFIFVSVSVSFSTIRLAMYAHKKEIEIMRLIGASNWYIRMPFIIEGAVFGIVGCALTIVSIFPVIMYISPKISQFLPGFSLYDYFASNLFNLTVLMLTIGMGLGMVGSFIAIRRYLKV